MFQSCLSVCLSTGDPHMTIMTITHDAIGQSQVMWNTPALTVQGPTPRPRPLISAYKLCLVLTRPLSVRTWRSWVWRVSPASAPEGRWWSGRIRCGSLGAVCRLWCSRTRPQPARGIPLPAQANHHRFHSLWSVRISNEAFLRRKMFYINTDEITDKKGKGAKATCFMNK